MREASAAAAVAAAADAPALSAQEAGLLAAAGAAAAGEVKALEVTPPVAPWTQPSGFSFAKVLRGVSVAEKAAAEEAVKSGGSRAAAQAAAEAAAAAVAAAEPSRAPTAEVAVAAVADQAARSELMSLLGVAPPGDTVAPQMVVAPPVAMMGMTAPPILPCMVGKPPAEVAAMHAVMMEFGRRLQAPLSAAHLEGVAEEARDAMLGERVYALVYPWRRRRRGR